MPGTLCRSLLSTHDTSLDLPAPRTLCAGQAALHCTSCSWTPIRRNFQVLSAILESISCKPPHSLTVLFFSGKTFFLQHCLHSYLSKLWCPSQEHQSNLTRSVPLFGKEHSFLWPNKVAQLRGSWVHAVLIAAPASGYRVAR